MPSTTPTSSTNATSATSRASQLSSAATEKPARTAPAKKSATPKVAAEKPARATAARKPAPKKKSNFEAPAEAHWHRMISETAYYRAESRGFAAGHEHEDWAWAEEQVRKILSP